MEQHNDPSWQPLRKVTWLGEGGRRITNHTIKRKRSSGTTEETKRGFLETMEDVVCHMLTFPWITRRKNLPDVPTTLTREMRKRYSFKGRSPYNTVPPPFDVRCLAHRYDVEMLLVSGGNATGFRPPVKGYGEACTSNPLWHSDVEYRSAAYHMRLQNFEQHSMGLRDA